MNDIEFAFSQIHFFLDALQTNNGHVLSESDADRLTEARELVGRAGRLCAGEWNRAPGRKYINVQGGQVKVTE
ncbi:MAG: hypothetical protein MK235_03840 [Candidatus Poseidoniales archaeon]|nr:hypothetical protein [Candidatus Poseidoniales archaeon]